MGHRQVTGNLDSADYLELNISVLFPHAAAETSLDNFATYLPGFTQSFGNLTEYVYFNNLAIEGAWQDVLSTVSGNAGAYSLSCDSMSLLHQALTASRISVKNSFASIRGAFYASQSISLDTIKGCVSSAVSFCCVLWLLIVKLRNLTTDVILTSDPNGQALTSLTLNTGDG